MGNELVINSINDDCRIALLKDGNLFEYHVEKEDNRFTVGDIYLGIIKKIVPSLNACFVDVGYHKDAFLHYLDLGPQFNSLQKAIKIVRERHGNVDSLANFSIEPIIDKLGKVGDVLMKGQEVLVQIVKEPISNKGPRISSELAFPGRYMILIPFVDTISISKKITNPEERDRLHRLIASIKEKNFGIIVRTVAKGIDVATLDRDLKDLVDKWKKGMKQLATIFPGEKVIGEVNRTYTILRDMLNESFDSIIVDDKSLYAEVKQYIHTIAPEKEKILKLHQSRFKLFEQLGIEKQLKTLFGQTVGIDGGGYLIIEHTEAMHVIDVNSGNRALDEEGQGKTALNANLAAAKEIARQLRLRDMGGIIVIDFIDLKDVEDRKLLYQKVKEFMKEDRAKASVLPLSKFGVMQITRQRVRPEMNVVTRELCPSCNGTGKIDASLLVSERIESDLSLILMNQNEKNIKLLLHPYLYAYFTQNWLSKRLKWFLKYGKWVTLVKDSSMAITDYKFLDKNQEEIELR
ncbi:Rne/Rng family ribonuclease [Cardinium endosymbiont of Culicoides punctatus]|uniref:Rne/Rng family ribonuclease n=1 Tax=Cardinium endosymbiont of Culicoides punctatus TaxID=2304601 RepID=UPI001058B23A|nr:Rne/Rng family ribonuclease [Cardinium endosymbiont of Culicoides punctatus]TDG95744.1 Ribonuclease G [Cardinium endosymbiont of Culicoides punctatus]